MMRSAHSCLAAALLSVGSGLAAQENPAQAPSPAPLPAAPAEAVSAPPAEEVGSERTKRKTAEEQVTVTGSRI